MADNPFDPKPIGLLGLLGAEARPKSLLDYIGTPAPTLSPAARTIVNLLTDASTPANSANALSSALGLGKSFGSNALAGILSSEPPSFPNPPPLGFGSALANPIFGSSLHNISTPVPTPALYVPPPKPKPVVAQTKRKGFSLSITTTSFVSTTCVTLGRSIVPDARTNANSTTAVCGSR